MIVLSLFDGQSCGQQALKELGQSVTGYYASEIKKHAIKCTKANFPDTIHIGDVRKVSYNNGILETENGRFEVGTIDILIGGSPCQDLSVLMNNREGLQGNKSSLFYQYLRLLKEVKPTYFLLENVASMKQADKETIDYLVGQKGIMINSALVSAQIRKRYYWTNIAGVTLPADQNIELQSILESGYTKRKKSVCIVRNYAGSVQSSDTDSFIRMANARAKKGFLTVVYEKEGDPESVRLFTRRELERLQTLPEGYTDSVSYKEAVDLIGDGWSIAVIKHIFKGLLNN